MVDLWQEPAPGSSILWRGILHKQKTADITSAVSLGDNLDLAFGKAFRLESIQQRRDGFSIPEAVSQINDRWMASVGIGVVDDPVWFSQSRELVVIRKAKVWIPG